MKTHRNSTFCYSPIHFSESRLFFFSALGIRANFKHHLPGRLSDGGTVANGAYDLAVQLYDALSSGNLQVRR